MTKLLTKAEQEKLDPISALVNNFNIVPHHCKFIKEMPRKSRHEHNQSIHRHECLAATHIYCSTVMTEPHNYAN